MQHKNETTNRTDIIAVLHVNKMNIELTGLCMSSLNPKFTRMELTSVEK